MGRALPRLLVAATRGGSGKTTLTLGLVQALRDRGLKVAPFKKGPDYIDPFWHSEAAGYPCRNLDPFMMSADQVARSFLYHSSRFDCAVVEGNRGLYDGMDAQGSYSSAQLAKQLGAPVLVALDCTMTSRTVAALALGLRQYDPELNLAGFILNPVGTARQEALVRGAVEQATGLPVLGAVPRLRSKLPERHMGLVPPQEHREVAQALHQAARNVAGYVDLDALWKVMRTAPPVEESPPPLGLMPAAPPDGQRPRIGVVRDAAFGFYYQENLEALANHGAELVFCSALEDQEPPPVDAVYIGGGFPETHAQLLAGNQSFRSRLLEMGMDGLPIYAECGGMMYLGRHLVVDGASYPMVGLLPIDFQMRPKPQGHGYSVCRVDAPNPFLRLGEEFRAHEFHYSEPVPQPGADLRFAYHVSRGKGIKLKGGGLMVRNTLGSYHHIHALGLTSWAEGMVRAAQGKTLKS